jgi:Spy/CpxP family protein refolding chaperone
MNKFISNISRLAAACFASAWLNAVIVLAADTPADPAIPKAVPAAPAPTPAPADNAASGGRQGRRGNLNPGNPNPGGLGGPGGNFQGGRGNNNNFGGGGPGGGGGFNLDDKQRELFREATQNESDELRKLNDKLQAAQKELVQSVVAEKYDETVVRQKAEAVSKIQTEITVLRAKAFSSVSPTLKPEQREQLDQNWRVGVGFIMGGGIGFGGGNVAVGNFGGGGRGGPPVDVTQGGGRRGAGGGNGGPPDQPRRRNEPAPVQ